MDKSALALLLLLSGVHLLWGQELAYDQRLKPYVEVLNEYGVDPLDFVMEQLQLHDLLIFDDALHSAVEPFDFYQKLVETPDFYNSVKYIFLEVIPVNKQYCLDSYLHAASEDPQLLYPAFQNSISGFGWRYKTYFDLLHTIYVTNQLLPEDERIRLIAVNNPTYWSEIHTVADVKLFRKSLAGRDHSMYAMILSDLDYFNSGRKGVFITNTRHAYKGIKRRNGQYYWNTGTFFHQWHPDKTYSIRFHNVTLYIENNVVADSMAEATTEGMEKISFKWVRMEKGLWDSAFRKINNRAIAIPLKDNIFGRTPYLGNHMLNSAQNHIMYDAYDGLIFLAPLEDLRQAMQVDNIYTPAFKEELERRYKLLLTNSQLEKQFAAHGVSNLRGLIDKRFTAIPEQPLPQAQSLSPIDEWRNE